MGACATYDDLMILEFKNPDDSFQVDQSEIDIGLSVRKGNTELLDAANKVLAGMNEDDFNKQMNEAIAVQPQL